MEGVIDIKVYEILRTRDLKSFYVIAKNELNAIQIHYLNLNKENPDSNTRFFDTGYSYNLIHGGDVYNIVYKYRSKDKNDD